MPKNVWTLNHKNLKRRQLFLKVRVQDMRILDAYATLNRPCTLLNLSDRSTPTLDAPTPASPEVGIINNSIFVCPYASLYR